MENKLRNTNLNNKIHSGKVRDIYSMDENLLLFVATDRISAFDVIMNEGVPSKGIILNNLSAFWGAGPINLFRIQYFITCFIENSLKTH